MTKWLIRGSYRKCFSLPDQEIESECQREALDIYAVWLVKEFGFDLRRLSCIDIDRVEDGE